MGEFEGRGLGYVPDLPDHRDLLWRACVAPVALTTLPSSFRCTNLGPVLDQGQEGACVAFAASHQKQSAEFKEHRRYYDFQPFELYARCKELDGIPNESGTYPRVALKLMQDRGVLAKKKLRNLKADTFFKIQSYVRLTSTQQIKESLVKYGPTFFAISVDSGCYSPDKNGIIAEPDPSKVVGGHAILIVGYNDNKKCNGSTGAFIVKNSWGAGYGKKGYAYWPYTHFSTYSWDAYQIVDTKDLV